MPSLAQVFIRPRKASRVAAGRRLGSAGDLAPGDLGPDVVLGVVGVQGHVGTVQHHEEFVAVGVQPRQQPVQGGEPGTGLKGGRSACASPAWPPAWGVAAIGLEISVQPPDAGPNTLLGPALVFAEGVQLVHQALCMHPAQCMAADVELEQYPSRLNRTGSIDLDKIALIYQWVEQLYPLSGMAESDSN